MRQCHIHVMFKSQPMWTVLKYKGRQKQGLQNINIVFEVLVYEISKFNCIFHQIS